MKHTTRKKMLLSSIAMLLVALVALGSATYAWFTANPNAEAHGVKMRTTASTGLVIRTETDATWSHSAKLRNGESDYFNLNPVSQDQSAPDTFKTMTAAAADSYNVDATKTAGDGAKGTDYYAEKVYFNLSAGSDVSSAASKKVYITGVTINKATGATMENAIRVAIADASGTLLGTWALSTGGSHGVLLNPSGSAASFSPALAATSTALHVDTNQDALLADGSLTKYVTVYCYLDGQDSNTFSDKVGTANAEKIIESVQVDFTLA